MAAYSVALLVYGDKDSTRNALVEEKYKDLADAFVSAGFTVDSVLYNDEKADELRMVLLRYNAVLVWVNPIEQGRDRKRLDALLTDVVEKGSFVSAHPDVILKMGTKDVLFKTKDMEWGSDTEIYTSFQDFVFRFPGKLKSFGTRVLKQHRGNGGNGVYKLVHHPADDTITLIHAAAGHTRERYSFEQVYEFFKPFYASDGLVIDQEWNKNITNGMVRCYVTGAIVSGFGYQEINALYELAKDGTGVYVPPGRRYYFTEHCGLFGDLKRLMEEKWIGDLQKKLSINDDKMPVIWDADFFINHTDDKKSKYTICEINVSSVSPFPPSSIPYIVQEVRERLALLPGAA